MAGNLPLGVSYLMHAPLCSYLYALTLALVGTAGKKGRESRQCVIFFVLIQFVTLVNNSPHSYPCQPQWVGMFSRTIT